MWMRDDDLEVDADPGRGVIKSQPLNQKFEARKYQRKKFNSGVLTSSDNPNFKKKAEDFNKIQRKTSYDNTDRFGSPPGAIDDDFSHPLPHKMKSDMSSTERKMREKGLELTYDPNRNAATSGWTSGARGNQNHYAAGSGNGGRDSMQGNSRDLERDKAPVNFDEVQSFINQPCPKGSPHLFRINRKTSGLKNKIFPKYELILEDGNRFLLAAKKRKKKSTSNYLIGLNSDVHKGTDQIVGKVRSNMMGTSFMLYNEGKNPAKVRKSGGEARTELGCVLFERDLQGKRPRKMTLAVPSRNENSHELASFQPANTEGQGSIIESLRANNDDNDEDNVVVNKEDNIVKMINKPPTWDPKRNCYSMNFGGRVTAASVKNFQMVQEEDPEAVILQFGKVGKNEFTCDVRWPLSPLQAFGICLSSFDLKFGAT